VLQNDFLYNLFAGGAIDLTTMLENTSYPFATRLLEAVKRKEQQAQEAMAQYQEQAEQAVNGQTMSPQFQQAMNGTPGAQDGMVQKVRG
jgi:DNA polymerase IIIc chi subunit